MRSVVVFVHLVGVVIWVGGMFFAHHVLRPSIAALDVPVRLGLMRDALGRFFRFVAVAIALIWISGLARYAEVGGAAPVHWHLMALIGALMTGIFVWIRVVPFRLLQATLEAGDLPAAGQAVAQIRKYVMINLVLGFATIAVATQGVHVG